MAIGDIDQFVDELRGLVSVEIPDSATVDDDLHETLGFDSLDTYELLMVTETLAGDETPPLEPPKIVTLADAFAYYQRLCRGASPAHHDR
jgi:acyl carrier protein